MTSPLLQIRPKPQAGESLLGYCLRLGHANGYPGQTWLPLFVKKHDAAKQNLTLLTGHDQTGLECLTGPAPASLGRHSHHRFGLKVTYWNHHHRRWCPVCLAEHGIWQMEWLLTLQIACPTHRLLLREKCPGCDKLIRWHQGTMFTCSCGADLRHAATRPGTAAELALAKLIAQAIRPLIGLPDLAVSNIPTPPELDHLHPAQLCDLLWFFGAYASHRPNTRPQKIADHGRIEITQPYLQLAMQIAQHWPQRFHQLLEEYTLPISGNTASLRVYLREIHQALYRLLIHPELLFVREEFERYVHARWPDKLILQQDLRQAHPIISLAKAAEQLNLSRGAVHKLIESGAIKGCQSSSAKGKATWMVERSSLDAYARNEHGTLTISEVERMLRITPKRIRLLIESGLLQPLPHDKKRTRWCFQLETINAFLEQLNHSQISPEPNNPELLSVWEITKRWMQGSQPFLAVVRALQDGSLEVVGRTPADHGLRALLVSRQQFTLWHEQYRRSRGFFTVREAAAAIQMDVNLLYHLIGAGHAHASQQQYGYEKRMLLGIEAKELERLTNNYIWGEHLAEMVNKPVRQAARHLVKQGLCPLYGPMENCGDEYVFWRADVAASLT